ncbi:MAG TPA: amidohydrolase family protein [Chloroflexota bacterium]|nr:amidohydrolase family protein [Chloroflexota bacterium]
MGYRCISADNHLDLLWMPRDTWQARLPSELRESGPKVVETDRGSFWEYEGELHGAAADGSSNGALLRILTDRGFEAPPGSLPPSDPSLLLEYMDQSGVYAAVTFGGLAWKGAKNPILRRAIYAAYNEFALEVRAAAPQRLVMLPNVTSCFPEECSQQITQLAKLGVKAVEFPYWDAGVPLNDELWEPTWAVAEEAGVRVCGHLGLPGGAGAIPGRRRGANLAWASTVPMTVALPIAQLIFSGVFERHPTLRFCFAETRIGWAPFFLDWMDRQVRIGRERDPRFLGEAGREDEIKLSMLPSEYFKRNVVLTFEDDTIGTQLLKIPAAGLAETALWGGDFPHPQGVWGRDIGGDLDGILDGVSEPIKQRILFAHAAEFFGIAYHDIDVSPHA